MELAESYLNDHPISNHIQAPELLRQLWVFSNGKNGYFY